MHLDRRVKFLPRYRYQPEMITHITELAALGYVVAERSLQHLDKFVRDTKDAGIWNLLQVVFPFVGVNLVAACVGIRPGQTRLVGSPVNLIDSDYSELTGITGDGVTKYLDTNFSANLLTANNCHLAAYHRADNAQGGNRLLTGAGDGTQHYWMGALVPASATDSRLGQTQTASGGGQMIKGFYIVNRAANNDLKLYRNGVQLGANSNATAGAGPALNIFAGAWNNTGSPAGYLNTPISFLSIGQSMNTQQLTDFYSIVQTLQTNLGRAV